MSTRLIRGDNAENVFPNNEYATAKKFFDELASSKNVENTIAKLKADAAAQFALYIRDRNERRKKAKDERNLKEQEDVKRWKEQRQEREKKSPTEVLANFIQQTIESDGDVSKIVEVLSKQSPALQDQSVIGFYVAGILDPRDYLKYIWSLLEESTRTSADVSQRANLLLSILPEYYTRGLSQL